MYKIKTPSHAVTSLGKCKTSYRNIIASVFKKINVYFLEDEETGECGSLSDHLIFYGALGFHAIVGVYCIYKLFTL